MTATMMRRLLLVAAAFIFCRQAVAQDSFSLDDYKSLKFYGIDFAPAQVVGAEEGASEFIEAFGGINSLFLSEPEKYIDPLAEHLKIRISDVKIEYALKSIETIDGVELKVAKAPARPFTEEELSYTLLDLDIEPSDGLGLVVTAGELNKETGYGTYYYVFFDNKTMEVLDVWPMQGKGSGAGVRSFWTRSFSRTIAEINPTKFYQAKKRVKEGVTEGAAAVKDAFGRGVDKVKNGIRKN